MDISGFETILTTIKENQEVTKNINNDKQIQQDTIKQFDNKNFLKELEQQNNNNIQTNNNFNKKKQNAQAYIHSGHRQRARDRFLLNPNETSDYDLLELLLFLTTPRVDTKPLAKVLINKYKTIRNIFLADTAEINSLGCNGNSLKYLYTLMKTFNKRVLMQEINNNNFEPKTFENIIEYCKNLIGDLQYEEFHILFFDAKLKLILEKKIGIENIAEISLSTRNIIQQCLSTKSVKIVLTHNHPSGDIQPSDEDLQTTLEIKNALKNIDVAILDHIIVSGNKYFSMAEHNFI